MESSNTIKKPPNKTKHTLLPDKHSAVSVPRKKEETRSFKVIGGTERNNLLARCFDFC